METQAVGKYRSTGILGTSSYLLNEEIGDPGNILGFIGDSAANLMPSALPSRCGMNQAAWKEM